MLYEHPRGTVALAKWMKSLGISSERQRIYHKNGWLEAMGPGVYKIKGDCPRWEGGIFAIQRQANLPIFPAAKTALCLLNVLPHDPSERILYFFSPLNKFLPRWFSSHLWQKTICHFKSSQLSSTTGLIEHQVGNFTIQISGAERAILECLYLVPNRMGIRECELIMQHLHHLDGKIVQQLLEECSSYKVKRQFLLMAIKAKHDWIVDLDFKKIDLGAFNKDIVDDSEAMWRTLQFNFHDHVKRYNNV